MKNKKLKILIILGLIVLTTTGCTKILTDSNKKQVKNDVTGQVLTQNILCKPKDTNSIKKYIKNKVDINKLPECTKMKINDGKYEGLWTDLLVKPSAFILIKIGMIVKNYGLSLIIVGILIRLLTLPLTIKATKNAEIMKKLQPEMLKIRTKYEGKTDQESIMKQNQEMMMLYQKYNFNPLSGIFGSFINLPIFFAFLEAVQRTPAIFEDKFLGFQLGTTPAVGLTTPLWFLYVLLVILIGYTTHISFKSAGLNTSDESTKNMPKIFPGMIMLTGLFMPSALALYWITSNLFVIIQSRILKKGE